MKKTILLLTAAAMLSGCNNLVLESGHGYGHLMQTAAVLDALATRVGALEATVRTTLPADLVQRRLTTLLAPPPAAGRDPAPRPVRQPVKERVPAAPPRPAASRWLEEPLVPPPAVNDTAPPPRPAAAKIEAANDGRALRDPTNVGSQRLLELADRKDVYDTCLWTATAAASGAPGNSTALVGTPDEVAEALVAYYDLGVRSLLVRGYDPLPDAVAYGEELIPRVRALVAKRES